MDIFDTNDLLILIGKQTYLLELAKQKIIELENVIEEKDSEISKLKNDEVTRL